LDQIIIPKERVSEIRTGKKRILERKFLPGYILVHMELNEDTYFLVKKTPGVTGFIGLGKLPSHLQDTEVESIFKKIEEAEKQPAPRVIFKKGQQVRISDGPFVNSNGTIEEVYPEKGRLKVSVSIFGRSTPVELEYWQVERI
jgi:transcriptional antiterminator NusG